MMADMEKVIKGLTMCRIGHCDYRCPYVDINVGCKNQLNDDAIALLKGHEAVKPEREHSGGGTTWWNVCGNCKTAINPNDKFCHECGRPVKWE